MKFLNIFILSISSLVLYNCKENNSTENTNTIERPNIIFILADDYGIMDSQAYAEKFTGVSPDSMFYETPNINRLVEEGTSFSQAYANQLCSPTRASILTGMYAGRLGFTTAMPPKKTYYNQKVEAPKGYYIHDVFEHKDNGILIEQALINGISNSAVPSGDTLDKGQDVLSIAEALKGYNSGFIGKWHVGGFGAKGYQLEDQGFEPIAWFDAGGSPYYNWKGAWNSDSHKLFPKLTPETFDIGDSGKDTKEEYLTDALTIQALHFIEEKNKVKDKPFFLYFSHFAIHSPYKGKEDEIAYFEEKETLGWNNHKDPVYASMIKSLDRSVGAILKKLEELDIEENTLVVFMSDNGGIDSKITPRGDGTDNSPFLGGKACLTEGGIRVPLVFRWKGKIASKKWVDIPVDCTDIYPTILEAAGFDTKEIISENKLDGESLMALIEDTKNEKNSYKKTTHYWHYPFNVIYKNPLEPLPLTPHSAIREGDYKLIFDWYGRYYLYNIQLDPFEKTNLAESNPDLTHKLFNKLMNWLNHNVEKRYWPTLNPDYNPKKEARNVPFIDYFSENKSAL